MQGEGGMTNLAAYQDWETHILCMSCVNVNKMRLLRLGYRIDCICADYLMKCNILLFGSIFDILLSCERISCRQIAPIGVLEMLLHFMM